jgi:hypothetical protein
MDNKMNKVDTKNGCKICHSFENCIKDLETAKNKSQIIYLMNGHRYICSKCYVPKLGGAPNNQNLSRFQNQRPLIIQNFSIPPQPAVSQPALQPKINEPEKTKICVGCNITRPLYHYNKHKSTDDGYTNYCKNCINNKKTQKK